MKLINELGERIEHTWRDQNFSTEAFPSICAEAIREARIHEQLTPWDIADWALDQDALPRQQDLNAGFGQPPITIYNGSRFYVEAYFWLEGTTSVHQHAFCGAFQVLHGSSLHSWYEFELDHVINQVLELGTMKLKTCEILNVGDVQEITPGRGYVHSLFHLDQPSVTLIARDYQTVNHLPQFDYRKPGLAVDPFYVEQTLTKQLQIAASMITLERPEIDGLLIRWIERSDLYSAYRILSQARAMLEGNQIDETFGIARSKERIGALMSAARKRHGSHIDLIERAFEYQSRVATIVRMRSFVKDSEPRFFLSLLMNLDDRESILKLVRSRFPDTDPLDKLLDCIFALSQTRVVGLNPPNALGIQDFGDLDIVILEYIFEGLTDEEVRTRIIGESDPADVESFGRLIGEKIDRIKTSPVLQPLLVR